MEDNQALVEKLGQLTRSIDSLNQKFAMLVNTVGRLADIEEKKFEYKAIDSAQRLHDKRYPRSLGE